MGGSTKTQTTTQTSEPWKEQIPFLTRAFEGAQALYDQGPLPVYGGTTVPSLSQDTQQALQLKRQGVSVDPNVLNATNQQLIDTLQGNYLNSNPYLNDVINIAQQNTVDNYSKIINPRIMAGSERTGNFFSSSKNQQLEQSDKLALQELGNIATNIAGQNYQSERQRQLGALGLVPGIVGQQTNTSLANIGLQSDVGNVVDLYNRAKAEEEANKFYQEQQSPFQNLARYFGVVGANVGGGQVTAQQPVYSNKFGTALGLASLFGAPFTGGASLGLSGASGGLQGLAALA